MTGQYGSLGEPQIKLFLKLIHTVGEYYQNLVRMALVHMCTTSAYISTTPAATALFIILVPAVHFIYTRRIEAYAL